MSTQRQIRCSVYTRKSTEEGLEQNFNSLDAQREACEAYIASQKAEGWQLLRERYDDGGYSGGTLDRPALQRLLKDIEAGRVDVVVVYKIDRLSRSLIDFARLVEAFDRRGVTFVSVTQSFNTTTSMGRLTLNVLLSFAQFEREVTGERIRDKFAASKKKGMWMGGNPPLGYDVAVRKLIVNPSEAETVRLIFQRYLDLGCTRLLSEHLKSHGVVSKLRKFGSGETRGGKPLGRSAINCILNNRAYIGEVTHKSASYPGEHQPIVSHMLFDAVRRRLAELRPAISGKQRQSQDAVYTRRLFDETGAPMLPTYTIKRGSIRYRYYASRPTLNGKRSEAGIYRVPAPAFEGFMFSTIERLGLTDAAIARIEIRSQDIIVWLKPDAVLNAWQGGIQTARTRLKDGERLDDDGERLVLTLPVRAQFRGGRAALVQPGNAPARATTPDVALIKAVARAHRWIEMLKNGEVTSIEMLARQLKQDRGHVGRTLNLAFLNPAITKAILAGEQPLGLRLTHLLNVDIPLGWRDQEAQFFQPSGA